MSTQPLAMASMNRSRSSERITLAICALPSLTSAERLSAMSMVVNERMPRSPKAFSSRFSRMCRLRMLDSESSRSSRICRYSPTHSLNLRSGTAGSGAMRAERVGGTTCSAMLAATASVIAFALSLPRPNIRLLTGSRYV
ncbi:hypothetical protein D3C78_1231980 [compost metagenome]